MLALIMNFILSKISQYNSFSHLFNIKNSQNFILNVLLTLTAVSQLGTEFFLEVFDMCLDFITLYLKK